MTADLSPFDTIEQVIRSAVLVGDIKGRASAAGLTTAAWVARFNAGQEDARPLGWRPDAC